MADEIRFEDPPSIGSKRQRADRAEVARLARTQPGAWVCVPDQASSTGGTLRSGGRRGFRDSSAWEVTQRSRGDGRVDVYIRYVGTTGAQGPRFQDLAWPWQLEPAPAPEPEPESPMADFICDCGRRIRVELNPVVEAGGP